jgi:hypothetical protein
MGGVNMDNNYIKRINIEKYTGKENGLKWEKTSNIVQCYNRSVVLYNINIIYYISKSQILISKSFDYDNNANPIKIKQKFNKIVNEIIETADKIKSVENITKGFKDVFEYLKIREEVKLQIAETL